MSTRTNEEWLCALQSHAGEQATAIVELRGLLLRAALYSFKRTHYDLCHLHPDEILQHAEDSAQDALLAVMKHLDEFRGESKFTTWAYKFAINVALARARKETWKRVSLDKLLEDSELPELSFADESRGMDPDRAVWQAEVWDIVREVIDNELTERQRQVLKVMVFDDAQMDEVAEHFKTNRNAIYKLMHDARRKLKARLEARGLEVTEIVDLFAKA
jgi:RNA polymerase sigma-70 factor, ECF subfamily